MSEKPTHVRRNKGDRVTFCGQPLRGLVLVEHDPTCPTCKAAYLGTMRRYWGAKGRYRMPHRG